MASKNVIDPNSIENIYLFYGEEAYKKRNYKTKLKKLIAGDGSLNYAYFEGKNIDFSAVYDSVVTMPFFAQKRLVIVENSGKFAGKKNKNTEDEDNSSDKSDLMLEKILKDLPKTTCLAFFEEEINKTKKVYKTIAARGMAVSCDKDEKEDLVLWLAKGFAAAKKNVRKSTLELMVDRAGCDYDRLRSEYEKVVSYAAYKDEVTNADVLAVTSEDIEAKIFDMLDAMCSKDTGKVLEKYYGLTVNKEHPLYILAMIRTQFRSILQIAELYDDGMNKYDIAALLKKKTFVVDKSLRYARHFKSEELENIMDKISDIDMRMKNGDIDEQIGVEMLLIDISR